jgi:hypothetical protein
MGRAPAIFSKKSIVLSSQYMGLPLSTDVLEAVASYHASLVPVKCPHAPGSLFSVGLGFITHFSESKYWIGEEIGRC